MNRARDTSQLELISDFFTIFTNPKRIQILQLLREGELTVSEIAEKTGLSQPTVSQHLKVMRDKHIITSRRRGNKCYYAVEDGRIYQVCDIIKGIISKRIEEIRKEITRP
ncbi:MAG: metalloregulator ArsR/SmtB family transcription factor [Aigarchaeota archaeon]|nr:metalloregulator ArsR/SmtB family transcription factor [Candidatus Calditenuaceae archaeon]